MPVRQILRMGDPRLSETAKIVDNFSQATLGKIIDDMIDTMRAANGAGLAAPQIGIPYRIVVYEIKANPRYPDAEALPLTVLVNPDLQIDTVDVSEAWEGCLSVPGMRGLVPRYETITVKAQTKTGEFFEQTVSGFHARVIQHETDHLDGILYPQRIKDLTQFGFITELEESDRIIKVPAE